MAFIRLSVGLILSALFCNCSNDRGDTSSGKVTVSSELGATTLERLVERLPVIDLPWSFDLRENEVQSIELSSIEIQLLANDPAQEAGSVLGILENDHEVIHILWLTPADSELPVISSFSSEGQFLRSTCLAIGNCAPWDEPCFSCHETIRIGTDRTILATDTVTSCECDSLYEPIQTPCTRYV